MKTKIKIFKWLIVLAGLALVVSACADVTPIEQCITDAPYNFWGGLWHGFIAPVSFVGSLFNDNIALYAVNNNGGWYDFGFVLGAGIIFGGSSRAA
ncbi:MAG: hypothetical protein EOM83_05110 [Clostridia bacterium]|nr:hypothetical protein [Clostridia bacterium]